ncbi:MAG: monovalent cation:proton antiporter family protein, partial [Bacteroidales bacterium]|nr:monovalent cation:proton antiporter family protein [Bacteroidales bacterium]
MPADELAKIKKFITAPGIFPYIYPIECMITLIPLGIVFGIDYLPLLVVVFIAWATPMLLSTFKLEKFPSVLIEMIAGYLLGRLFMSYLNPESLFLLDFLALTGLIFIMFLSGIEINIDQLIGSFPRKITWRGFLTNPLLSGIAHYMITLVLSLAGTYLLSKLVYIPNIWFFAIIPTTTFMGIVYPVLKNRGETRSYFGQTLIITSAVADVLSILIITITAIYLKFGFHYELLLVLGLLLFSFLVYLLGKKFTGTFFKRISFQQGHAITQITVRGAILLILVFVTIAQLAGPEVVVLGAFICGFVLSFFIKKERSLLIIKLEGIGFGFFIPIFFIMVGAKFQPANLLEFKGSLFLFLSLLFAFFFIVKILPSFIWMKIFRFRKSMAAGFLLAARLGLVIAAASVGLEMEAITSGANASFIIMVLVTCILSPVMYEIINKKPPVSEDKIVIVGGSSVGVILARRMKVLNQQALIIEKDSERYNALKVKGLSVVHGDATDPETYKKIKLSPENYVIVLTGSDEENLAICQVLRHELHHEKIISKPDRAAIDEQMELLNIETLDARGVLANAIENLILRPTVHSALIDTFEHFNVEDIIVSSDNVHGKQIMGIPFHKEGMILLVRKSDEIVIPHGDTYLRKGDIVTIFGTESALTEIRKLLR